MFKICVSTIYSVQNWGYKLGKENYKAAVHCDTVDLTGKFTDSLLLRWFNCFIVSPGTMMYILQNSGEHLYSMLCKYQYLTNIFPLLFLSNGTPIVQKYVSFKV